MENLEGSRLQGREPFESSGQLSGYGFGTEDDFGFKFVQSTKMGKENRR